MDNKFPNIKERVLQIAKHHSISYETFFEKIGMTYGNFKGKAKNTPLNSDAIANILSIYSDIDANWLLTGEGSMIIDTEVVADTYSGDNNEIIGIATPSDNGIPLIPIDAMAGFMTGDFAGVMEYECERYSVPLFRGAEFLISVKGSSMQPKYNSGDLVACVKIPLDTFFLWHKVYVIDTEQGVLIKRVERTPDDDYILLVSDNPAYPPVELHKSYIRSLASVIGVIRLE